MSSDVHLFWELMRLPDAKLIVDNDMCYVIFNENEEGDSEHKSFDFSNKELIFILAKELDIEAEEV